MTFQLFSNAHELLEEPEQHQQYLQGLKKFKSDLELRLAELSVLAYLEQLAAQNCSLSAEQLLNELTREIESPSITSNSMLLQKTYKELLSISHAEIFKLVVERQSARFNYNLQPTINNLQQLHGIQPGETGHAIQAHVTAIQTIQTGTKSYKQQYPSLSSTQECQQLRRTLGKKLIADCKQLLTQQASTELNKPDQQTKTSTWFDTFKQLLGRFVNFLTGHGPVKHETPNHPTPTPTLLLQ
jgi:hypothetical protein